jgi:DNA-directed RNA polymerase alpha subunit
LYDTAPKLKRYVAAHCTAHQTAPRTARSLEAYEQPNRFQELDAEIAEIKAKHEERTERALASLKQRFELLETEVVTFFAVDSAEITEQASKVAKNEFAALEVCEPRSSPPKVVLNAKCESKAC